MMARDTSFVRPGSTFVEAAMDLAVDLGFSLEIHPSALPGGVTFRLSQIIDGRLVSKSFLADGPRDPSPDRRLVYELDRAAQEILAAIARDRSGLSDRRGGS